MRLVTLVAMAAVLPGGFASAEQVSLASPITHFAADALGGIGTVVRYAIARPDRTETDYLLLGLTASDDAGATPEAIQVESVHGDPVVLSDVDGADCTLARTALVRLGRKAVLVSLVRADTTTQVLAGSLSGPGMMDLRVYRGRPGGAPGESTPVFTADAKVLRTQPVCSASEVEQAMHKAVSTILHNGDAR